MKKLLLCLFIVMSGVMNAATIKNPLVSGPTAVVTTITDAACGSSNGSITFGTVTDGVAPFTYSINNGVTFSSSTSYPNLAAGPYNLAVKDANGDIFTTSVTIADLSGPTAITTTIVNSTCGNADGSLTIDTVTGGVAPYTVNFNNSGSGWIPFDGYGGTTPLPSYYGLAAGTYSLEVRDANGCIYYTSITIIDTPGPTSIATTIVNPSSCTGNDGSVTIGGVTGGSAPYIYSFNSPYGAGPYSSATSYTGLAAGTYNLEVKDANGCIYSTTVTISPPVAITAVATTITDASFCGASDGSITIDGVTGGTAPYTYDFNLSGYSNIVTYTGLTVTSYPLSVKDANGCEYATTVTVNSTNKITAVASTVVNANCGASDGSITIDGVTGGVAPYTYSFNGTPYTSIVSYTGLERYPYYSLIVKDVNGCEYGTYIGVGNLPDNRTADITYPQAYYSTSLTSSQPIILTGTGVYTDGIYSTTAGLLVNSATGSIIPSNSLPGTYTVVYTLPSRGPGCPAITTTTTVTIYDTFGLTMSGIYSDFNADGFTNVGDVINYQFTITNFDSNPLTNITLANPNLTFTGGPIASLAGGASDSTTFAAVHVLTQNDINNGSVTVDVVATGTLNTATLTSVATTTNTLSISNGLKLIAFRDTNGNGIKDSGEANHIGGEFHYEINSNGTIHNVSSSSGIHTIYETNATNSYDVSFSTNNTYYTVNPSSYTNITVANGSGITTYNFPISSVPFTDLRVSIYPNGVGPRPGFTYQNQILIHNIGNQTIPSGTLTFTNDSRVTITNVSPSATMNATGFTYDYPSLTPNQSLYVTVTMQVPTIPTIALGDLLTNTVSVDIPAADINTANNTASLTQDVRGSYDPNDKNEAHGPQILHSTFTSNDYLSYTIQFENTGTAEAITVKVNDVLDAKLDETSIKMIDASHNYTLDRVGNDLTWTFSGINLPPSVAGTTTGKGYINFQVKPKAGYAIGDIINNTAYIYFDFNPAIVTNTFSTEFVNALGVAGFVNSQFSAYPNPTTGIITIALKNSAGSIDTITVTDVLGKTVLLNTVNAANTTVDLSNLTKGLYFVKIQAEGMVKTLKVVKE